MWHTKKKWIIIAVAAAVVILAGGIVGGVAYAQTTTTPSPALSASNPTLLARVAQILGIDQTKLQAAFTQAEKDQQNAAVSNRLNALVAQGKLTQQQANDYQTWLQSRPNVPAGLGLPNGPMMGPRGRLGFPGFRGSQAKPGPSSTPTPTVTP
jgi:uncharacterized membrane protein